MKLKLNIQKFSSTNATTHYELSQYIGSDKPTYLVDYNSDMNKIDTAIYGADAQATLNANNIGTMSNLNTEEKSSLVGAINEVNTQVGTNTTAIGNLNTETSANTGNIGTMANLETTEKSNLVGAINELKGVNDTQNTNITANSNDITSLQSEISKFNLNQFASINTNQCTLTNCTLAGGSGFSIATNSDGSLAKIYGDIFLTTGANSNACSVAFNSSLRPTSELTINGTGINVWLNSGNNNVNYVVPNYFTIGTDGKITIKFNNATSTSGMRVFLLATLIFVKDFGDTPV